MVLSPPEVAAPVGEMVRAELRESPPEELERAESLAVVASDATEQGVGQDREAALVPGAPLGSALPAGAVEPVESREPGPEEPE